MFRLLGRIILGQGSEKGCDLPESYNGYYRLEVEVHPGNEPGYHDIDCMAGTELTCSAYNAKFKLDLAETYTCKTSLLQVIAPLEHLNAFFGGLDKGREYLRLTLAGTGRVEISKETTTGLPEIYINISS